jgi:hypothetical protein
VGDKFYLIIRGQVSVQIPVPGTKAYKGVSNNMTPSKYSRGIDKDK